MANIQTRKAKDGSVSYRAQVRLAGHPPQTASFKRRTDAKVWAQKTEAAIRDGRYFPTNEARKHTGADLIDRWTKTREPLKKSGWASEKPILAWWKAEIGKYALPGITPALIAQKRDQLLQEPIGKASDHYRTPATVNRYLAALSRAFSEAVREWHWVDDNPVLRVSKGAESPGVVRYLSDSERVALLNACKSSACKELHAVVLLALTSGMRRGEILRLTWDDVDLQRKVAVIHKTKNGERRSAPLVPELVEALQELGKVRRLDCPLVFQHEAGGKPMDVRRWFHDAIKTAGVENFRFHDLRHTAASYLAMSGATTAEIAAVLGHKTLAMVKRYAHLSDQHTASVVDRMTKKFFGNA